MQNTSKNTRAGLMALLVGLTPAASAAQWTSSRADGHAPIGVMGDHRHEKGEVMLSYRFMYMRMDGSRSGTSPVTDQSVLANFMVTPTKMPMMMHMAGAMYAPSDAVTLMVMAPFINIEMDHITRLGGTRATPAFTTTARGIGDIGVGGLVKLASWGTQSVHLNVGVRLPTGSISQIGVTPMSMGNAVQLPYPMQLGSGTFDAEPGMTYLGQARNLSWGGQARAKIRFGDNDRSYRLSNQFEGTFWGAGNVSDHVGISLRLAAQTIGDISGADPAPSVNPMVVPTARTDLRSGTRFDGGLGLNIWIPKAKGLRFAAEWLMPLLQDLDGPQLETDWTLILGIQVVPVN